MIKDYSSRRLASVRARVKAERRRALLSLIGDIALAWLATALVLLGAALGGTTLF